jgi:hypothetical protein
MSKECSTYGGKEESVVDFDGRVRKKETTRKT